MKELSTYQQKVLAGEKGYSQSKIEDYRRLWSEQGYDVPPPPDFSTPAPRKKSSDYCVHRVGYKRDQTCHKCPKNTKTYPIFECGLHGECTFERREVHDDKMKLIKSCARCTDKDSGTLLASIEASNIAVGITTAPRKQETLQKCFLSLDPEWDPVIFAEPGVIPLGVEGVRFCQDGVKRGVVDNWRHAVRTLAALHPEAEWMLILQDDCVLSPGAREFIEDQFFPEDAGAISLYTSSRYTKGRGLPPGRFEISTRSFWGACALMMRRDVALEVVDHSTLLDWDWSSYRKRKKAESRDQIKHLDTILGITFERMGKKIYGFHPSLSQHIGETSTLGNGRAAGDRQAWKVSKNPDLDCVPGFVGQGHEFRSYNRMVADTKAWANQLKGTIGAVCGIPRSGTMVASILAQELHIPLVPIESLVSGHANYWRPGKSRKIPPVQDLLIVDDSSYSGSTMEQVREMVREPPQTRVQYGVLYKTIGLKKDVPLDCFGFTIKKRQTFEWFLFRNYQSQWYAVDMDGVLCEDWSGPETGEHADRYKNHLENAKPLTIPTYPVHAIVTGRLEIHREATERWLKGNGVEYQHLIMCPAGGVSERSQMDVGKWKGGMYRKLKETMLFVESCPKQSRKIHATSGKPALCYPTMEYVK